MPSAFVLVSTVIVAGGYGVLAWRLWREKLFRVYRYLFAFSMFEAVRVLVAGGIRRGTSTYANYYYATEPILWIFYALIATEVFTTALRSQNGISKLGRQAITVAVVTSAFLASLSLFVRFQQSSDASWLLESYITIGRVVFLSLLIFVLLLIMFLSWFPVPMTRNAMVHAGVFTFFFGAKVCILLLRNYFGNAALAVLNMMLAVITISSLALWSAMLTSQGELRIVRSGVRRNPLDQRRLLSQLESINRTLLHSARK